MKNERKKNMKRTNMVWKFWEEKKQWNINYVNNIYLKKKNEIFYDSYL